VTPSPSGGSPATDAALWGSLHRRIIWFFVLLALRAILMFGSRTKVVFVGNPPGNEPLILASNHVSHFDPPLIALAFPRPVDWMAMVELYTTGWSRRFFRAVNTIPVRRGAPDRAALREAVARLGAGRVVGVFPEGGIRDGAASLLAGAPPLRGAGMLARMSGARVVPCVILGSDRLYNLKRWSPWHRATVWIAFGEPFSANPEDDTFSTQLLESIKGLRDRLLTSEGATSADLPRSPKERMHEVV